MPVVSSQLGCQLCWNRQFTWEINSQWISPRQGTLSRGIASHETLLPGPLSQETILHGTVSNETILHGTVSNETILSGTVSNETILSGTVSHEVASHGTVLNGTYTKKPSFCQVNEEGKIYDGIRLVI